MNNIGIRFKDDDALGTGGEFRLRRSRVFNGGQHVGNIYAAAPDAYRIAKEKSLKAYGDERRAHKFFNRHTQPEYFFYAPCGKFNQPEFHGEHFATLTGCKQSLL